jgi:hypothetical protein
VSDAVDYDPEMIRRTHIDDAAFEAHLTGNDAGELPALAAFAEDLRTMTSGPGPAPSAQLAAMIAEGFSTEQGDLPATAASNVPGPAPQAAGLPKWRKRKMIEFIAGLSVAAKAAFGISMAAASVTAAGAAGALPEPAQNAVSAAVEAVTPFSFPDKASDKADFGGRVSTDATDGGVDGRTVAEDAKNNGEDDGDGDGSRPAAPGQNGLDQANTTPAAGHVPSSVPAGKPATAGTQGSTGTDTAAGTPAAGHLPEAVPAGPPSETPPSDAGSESSTGTDTATQTPAADYVPSSIPAGPPAGRP